MRLPRSGWSSHHEGRGTDRVLVLTLGRECAEFIAMELPQGDGFTRDFATAVAETWPADEQAGPGVAVVMGDDGLPSFRLTP